VIGAALGRNTTLTQLNLARKFVGGGGSAGDRKGAGSQQDADGT
jgi:hypothetical protein